MIDHEIATLRISATRELPLPCTLLVQLQGRQTPSAFTSSAARARIERRAQRGVWSPGEYELAAYAVQEGRAFARELAQWDARKVASGGQWSLTPVEALGGAGAGLLEHHGRKLNGGRIPEGALTLSWGQLLRRVGAELLEVSVEPEAPPAGLSAAESDSELAGEAVSL